MLRTLKLEDILDPSVWQKIQDSFAQATGFAAIVVDKEGMPLLKYSNFSEYCTKIRKTDRCKYCFLSDAIGGSVAVSSSEPVIYKCHAGLVDFAVPIIVQGIYMGAILAGQVRLSPEEEKLVTFVSTPEDKNFQTLPYETSEEMLELYQKTPIVSIDKIKTASELLFTLANHVAETRSLQQIEQKLHQKEIQLYEETRLRNEAETALKEADLKALKAQVNPHFLFNVLNTIGRLALLEGAEKTQEVIYEFADIMRYTLKQNEDLVPIKEELEHVQNYLAIQKIRLGERLKFSFDIDKKVVGIKCPPMIVQPFVENTINHVIEPRIEGGVLEIKVVDKGRFVEIRVEDDGDGIEKENVQKILNEKDENKTGSTGIGIVNVNKRMQYMFGRSYGVRIERSMLGGTCIKLRVPKEFKKSE